MSGGTVHGWAIETKGPAEILRWYFTTGGNQVGATYSLLPVSVTGSGATTALILTNPTSTDLTLTNLVFYGSQSSSLDDDMVSFATFTSGNNPFSGSPALSLGSLTLAGGESRSFTAAEYPGLATPVGFFVAVQGDVNGSSFRTAATVAPTPPGLVLAGMGILSLLSFAWLRSTMV
jgi:hypothetical protein